MRSNSYGLGLSTASRRYRDEQPADPKPTLKADGSVEHPVKREPTDVVQEAARSYAAFLESRERLRERGLI